MCVDVKTIRMDDAGMAAPVPEMVIENFVSVIKGDAVLNEMDEYHDSDGKICGFDSLVMDGW